MAKSSATDDQRVQLVVRIPRSLRKRLKLHAATIEQSVNAVVERAILSALRKEAR